MLNWFERAIGRGRQETKTDAFAVVLDRELRSIAAREPQSYFSDVAQQKLRQLLEREKAKQLRSGHSFSLSSRVYEVITQFASHISIELLNEFFELSGYAIAVEDYGADEFSGLERYAKLSDIIISRLVDAPGNISQSDLELIGEFYACYPDPRFFYITYQLAQAANEIDAGSTNFQVVTIGQEALDVARVRSRKLKPGGFSYDLNSDGSSELMKLLTLRVSYKNDFQQEEIDGIVASFDEITASFESDMPEYLDARTKEGRNHVAAVNRNIGEYFESLEKLIGRLAGNHELVALISGQFFQLANMWTDWKNNLISRQNFSRAEFSHIAKKMVDLYQDFADEIGEEQNLALRSPEIAYGMILRVEGGSELLSAFSEVGLNIQEDLVLLQELVEVGKNNPDLIVLLGMLLKKSSVRSVGRQISDSDYLSDFKKTLLAEYRSLSSQLTRLFFKDCLRFIWPARDKFPLFLSLMLVSLKCLDDLPDEAQDYFIQQNRYFQKSEFPGLDLGIETPDYHLCDKAEGRFREALENPSMHQTLRVIGDPPLLIVKVNGRKVALVVEDAFIEGVGGFCAGMIYYPSAGEASSKVFAGFLQGTDVQTAIAATGMYSPARAEWYSDLEKIQISDLIFLFVEKIQTGELVLPAVSHSQIGEYIGVG